MNHQKIALRTLERIETYREHYDQAIWVHGFINYGMDTHAAMTTPLEEWKCGTTACVAGHAVAAMIELYPEEESKVFKLIPQGYYLINFSDAGAYALGIDSETDAFELFKASNSYANVLTQLEELAYN